MSATQRFVANAAIRLFQLFCALFVLTGIVQIQPLLAAIALRQSGDISISDLCWKILAVTGPLIPSVVFIAAAELLVRSIKSYKHDPARPWLSNPMWAAKHIRLSNQRPTVAILAGMLFYLGIAVPLVVATEKTPFMVFGGILGLLLFGFSRMFWLNRRWNTAELRMAEVPGVIGGPFAGVAILQQTFPAGTPFEIRLVCMETYRSDGDDDGGASPPRVAWSSTIYIDKPIPSNVPNQTWIPFSFAIPFGCHESTDWTTKTDTTTNWNLVVKLKDTPSSGEAVFSVPVYRTAQSRPNFKLDESLVAPFEVSVEAESVLRRFNMRRLALPDGREQITFSLWNGTTLKAGIGLGLASVLSVFACFWFIPNYVIAAFVAFIPSFIVFAVGYTLVEMLLWKSLIELSAEEVHCESGLAGFRRSLRTSRSPLPEAISVIDYLHEKSEWYQVEIHAAVIDKPNRLETDKAMHDATSLILLKRINNRAESEAIAEWLNSAAVLAAQGIRYDTKR